MAEEIINREWFNRCNLQEIPQTIDEWVQKHILENGIEEEPQDTLTLLRRPPVIAAVSNPPPTGLVAAPEVQFQIYNTPPNGTCMIDALLMVCSPTYRKLDSRLYDTVGIAFRRSDFKNIVMCYYLNARLGDDLVPLLDVNGNPVQNREQYLIREIDNSEIYLEAQYLLPICYFYGINILVYTQSQGQEWSLRIYPDNKKLSDKCYIIHYNGVNHFSGMSSSVNFERNPYTIPYDTAVALLQNRITITPQLRELGTAKKKNPPSSPPPRIAPAADFDFSFLPDEETVNLPLSRVLSSIVQQEINKKIRQGNEAKWVYIFCKYN